MKIIKLYSKNKDSLILTMNYEFFLYIIYFNFTYFVNF